MANTPEWKIARQEVEDEGFNAYQAGNCEEQCPYPEGTPNYSFWIKGLRDARALHKKVHVSRDRRFNSSGEIA